jgi:hypothetical protein
MAHRVSSRRRNNLVAFGAKRTFSEARLPSRIYEYAPLALLWQITHAAACCRSIFYNAGIAEAVVERRVRG